MCNAQLHACCSHSCCFPSRSHHGDCACVCCVQVHSMALIDPVCCCMWSGHLIANFVYNPARSSTGAHRDTRTCVACNIFVWCMCPQPHTCACTPPPRLTHLLLLVFQTSIPIGCRPDHLADRKGHPHRHGRQPQLLLDRRQPVAAGDSLQLPDCAERACEFDCGRVLARGKGTFCQPGPVHTRIRLRGVAQRVTHTTLGHLITCMFVRYIVEPLLQDDLVPVPHVDHMVRHETNARIMFNPNMAHADFLFSPATQDKILAQFAEVSLWAEQRPSG